jgi:hypothetical protein
VACQHSGHDNRMVKATQKASRKVDFLSRA